MTSTEHGVKPCLCILSQKPMEDPHLWKKKLSLTKEE